MLPQTYSRADAVFNVQRSALLIVALATGVAARLGHPAWLYVEAKGPAVAFHFRGAPDREAARAEVNVKNKEGYFPVHLAAEKKHAEIVALLKAAGAQE